MSDLGARFASEMIETVYRTAGRETGYWASYFLRTVRRHGGVAAAKRLLETRGVSKGLLNADFNRILSGTSFFESLGDDGSYLI